jgi:hypothetical protein
MGPNLKFSAYFAGSAFAIAFLTGIFAGVGFGTVILRALIGAVVFAGLGYGTYIVISTRLPELLSRAAAPEREAEGYGQNVDIVVDDDDEVPDAAEELEAADEPSTAAEGEAGELEEVGDEESAAAGEGGDELVEEVEEVAASSGAPDTSSSGGEDVDENSVDALPDIGGFAGDFEAEGTEVVEDDEGGTSGSSRAREHGIQQDPEVIAKALQTVIKRDE